jgi:hypothetical protein
MVRNAGTIAHKSRMTECDAELVLVLPCEAAGTPRAKIIEAQFEPLRSVEIDGKIDARTFAREIVHDAVNRRRAPVKNDPSTLVYRVSCSPTSFFHGDPSNAASIPDPNCILPTMFFNFHG